MPGGATVNGPTLVGSMNLTQRKARYGVAYLRALCAQAGYPMSETSADEDIFAVDCTVALRAVHLRVQVKCTGADFSKGKQDLVYKVEDSWQAKWKDNIHPLYFVVVRVPHVHDSEGWLEHNHMWTLHHTAAYWTKVDPQNIPTHIRVPRSQALTAATICEWEDSFVAAWKAGKSA